MKVIEIFTDGATPNNQNKGNVGRTGGVGVFFGDDDPRNISIKLKETKSLKVTNNVCELTACLMGIISIITTSNINDTSIIIYSDSKYVIDSITKWSKNWEKNGWLKSDGKPVDNLDLIKKIYYLYLNHNIKFIHVNSHTKEPSDKTSEKYKLWYGNKMADKLAVKSAKI